MKLSINGKAYIGLKGLQRGSTRNVSRKNHRVWGGPSAPRIPAKKALEEGTHFTSEGWGGNKWAPFRRDGGQVGNLLTTDKYENSWEEKRKGTAQWLEGSALPTKACIT